MKKKILLVEDDRALAEGLAIILNDEDFEVEVLPDGKTLDSAVKNFRPDIFLLDYLLPGEDGCEISKRLRANTQTATTPIILMSASQKSMQTFAKSCGANAFLAKPFTINDMLELIQKVLPTL